MKQNEGVGKYEKASVYKQGKSAYAGTSKTRGKMKKATSTRLTYKRGK